MSSSKTPPKDANGKPEKASSSSGKKGWRQRFLRALERRPVVQYALKAARVNHTTAYHARKLDPGFAAKWEQAIEAGLQALESSAFSRATEGVVRGVWRTDAKGRPKRVETIREFSDALTIFLLKCHKPGRYREVIRSEVTGAEGGPLSVAVDPVVAAALAKAYGPAVDVAAEAHLLPDAAAGNGHSEGNGNGSGAALPGG